MEQVVNENLQESRIEACKSCPIYSTKYGGWCNRNLYVNPKTNDTSTTRKSGYFQGCGCKILLKIKYKHEKCPAGKW
jgi:hypothetical protein